LPCGHSPPTACRHAVSGTISLPSQGCFSPFPHGTSSLSVTREYLALPDGPGRFSLGSTCPAILRSHLKKDCIFKYGAVTLYGRPFHAVLLTRSYSLFNQEPSTTDVSIARWTSWLLWSYNPELSLPITRFGLFRFRSPLLSESLLFSLPSGTKMVHFPEFAPCPYRFRTG